MQSAPAIGSRAMLQKTTVRSAVLVGIDAKPIIIEASRGSGAGDMRIAGLTEDGARETRLRVSSALSHAGIERPLCGVNVMTPGGMLFNGSGTGLDLAIALAVGQLTGAIPCDIGPETVVVGELSLDGRVQPVRGVLAMLSIPGTTAAIVPWNNGQEASLARGVDVTTLRSLGQATEAVKPDVLRPYANTTGGDMADIDGRLASPRCGAARRAMEIAAAGGHGLLFVGEPGSGAMMLARRMPTIMPLPTEEEAMEIVRITSAAGLLRSLERGDEGPWISRPFRAPHHTVSEVGLCGGGSPPRPGEVTLAHRGVLYLDEVHEFRRVCLDTLRVAVSEKRITIARAREFVAMPSNALVVASTHPSPCGWAPGGDRCKCTIERRAAWRRQHLASPAADLLPLNVRIGEGYWVDDPVTVPAEPSSVVRERVALAQAFGGMSPANRRFDIGNVAAAALKQAFPGRGHSTATAVARTIANLRGSECIETVDVNEALILLGSAL